MNIQGLPISTADLTGVAGTAGSTQAPEQADGFGQILREAVTQIDQAQGQAQTKIGEVMQGNGGDLHTAMIAVEKADLSFQLMLQVRNKIVAAYQEVSRMNF
ncbi:MAG TPA: flagellar hook-basal body complex protein FliE [Candidatus Angelobacter sp.]|jgi:flagellar hook-basal body complex protein FliE|nr:flagellar hook-basal body complex protein FliE [Candidatus Angelobacter sp.]